MVVRKVTFARGPIRRMRDRTGHWPLIGTVSQVAHFVKQLKNRVGHNVSHELSAPRGAARERARIRSRWQVWGWVAAGLFAARPTPAVGNSPEIVDT